MPKVKQRSLRRSNLSSQINSKGLPASSSCLRCIRKSLRCIVMSDNRCSECVASGVEKKCNASGSCVGKRLSEQRVVHAKLINELAALSERIVASSNKINELEMETTQEYNNLLREVEEESIVSENSSVSSGLVNESVEASSSGGSRPSMVDASTETDPVQLRFEDIFGELPIEGGSDFSGGIVE